MAALSTRHTGETRQHGACGSADRWFTLPRPLSVRLAEKPCRWERRGEAFGKCTRPRHAEESHWGDPADGIPRKDLLTRRTVFHGDREGLPQSSSAGVVAGGGLSRSSRTAPKGFLGMGLSAGPCSASENGCRAKVIDRLPLRALTGSHIQEQKADGKGEEGE